MAILCSNIIYWRLRYDDLSNILMVFAEIIAQTQGWLKQKETLQLIACILFV